MSAPNGLCANLRGPYEGKLHDASMLRESGLSQQLLQSTVWDQTEIFYVFMGTPRIHIHIISFHPVRPQLVGPFSGNVTADQTDWNKSMSSVRVSVEWIFGDILNS